MEKQISDTELVKSNISSKTGSSNKCLKAPTRSRARCKVWYFGFVMNEAGVIVRRMYSVNTTSAFVET